MSDENMNEIPTELRTHKLDCNCEKCVAQFVTDEDGIVLGFYECSDCQRLFHSNKDGFYPVKRVKNKIQTIYKYIQHDDHP